MYRSARARRERRRRIQKLALGGLALLVLVIAAVAVVESGSDEHKATGCVILDVSESTAEARTRYPEEFRAFASSIAENGSGEICLVLAGAEPIAEGAPVFTSVAPAPENEGKPAGVAEVETNIENATAEVTRLTEDHSIREGGSGLVEAAAVAAEYLGPGDELIYLSDGLQWSEAGGRLMDMDLSPSGIAEIVNTLEERQLIPDLEGVKVYFPLMLYHPEGFQGEAAEANKIKGFWQAWAQATGAELTTGRLR
jgi:hypothetical protein